MRMANLQIMVAVERSGFSVIIDAAPNCLPPFSSISRKAIGGTL